MHGTYYKGSGPGGSNDHGADNTVNNSGGTPGHSVTQRPIAGPQNPGPPASRRKALAKKSGPAQMGMGPGAPNRNTSYPGSV
jgi:hypothetical protein